MIAVREVEYLSLLGEPVIRGITFSLTIGERVAILGANGAGKSTLISLLNGLFRPSAGKVFLDEQAIQYSSPGLRRWRERVATVLQEAGDQLLGPTVLQDVAMRPVEDGASDREAKIRAMSVLREFGIESLSGRPIHALSLGEKKRAALAGVLVGNPSVLLLDEPTAGLDARAETALLEILRRRSDAGMTVCIATHDTNLLVYWATRALVLDAGELVFDGSPLKLLHDWHAVPATRGLRSPSAESLRLAGIEPVNR